MGCDIHTVLEVKKNNKWYFWGDLDSEIGRDYEIFAVLANVRNTDEMPFIAEPKGWPKDVSPEASALLGEWDGDAHSLSWMNQEDLDGFDITQTYYDKRLILGKDAEGQVTATARGTTGTHLGEVGQHEIFSLWPDSRAKWEHIVNKLRDLKWKGDDTRLLFFFDN